MHNISQCLNWIQEGVKNPFLLAIIFYIHSLHNLNLVLVFMQITFATLPPETCVLLKATKETGLQQNMDITKNVT
jgi:hypothetical protein